MGLQQLAEAHGVTTEYVDGLGRHVRASDVSVMAVLRALGVEIHETAEAEALMNELAKKTLPMVPPCLACSVAEDCVLPISGPEAQAYEVILTLESGEARTLAGRFGRSGDSDDLTDARVDARIAGSLFLGALPVGYHRVTICSGQEQASCRLLISPSKAFGAPATAETA
jgi:4-alpha-glucanotransferase